MLQAFTGNAILAKTKAKYGRRLTRSQYNELIHKKSVADIAAYLRDETVYGEALGAIQPTQVHRGQLENLLQKSRFTDSLSLMRYAPEKEQNYYNYLIIRVEVDLILQMVRLLGNGHPEDFLAQYPAYVERRTCFSPMELAKVRSFEELVTFLGPTPYAKELVKCQPLGQMPTNYTRCEAVLRSYTYQRIGELIDGCFTGKIRGELREIFGTSIEILNITSIYRLKKFYPQMSPQEIQETLIPSWRGLRQGEFDAIIGAPTAEAFLKALSTSRFAKYMGSGDFTYIEYAQNQIKYRLNRRFLRFASDAPTAFTAYMVLSELEIQNLVTIIEAVRYHIPHGEIEKMLVLS